MMEEGRGSSVAQYMGTEAKDVNYHHFTSKETSRLRAWEGENIVLLTKSSNYPEELMGRLVSELDNVYRYYERMAGGRPKPWWSFLGKLTIAEVDSTGEGTAAMGFLGHTGVEISAGTMREALETYFTKGEIHNVFLWEFGRNFWFGERKPEGGRYGDLADAYAMALQTIAGNEAGIRVNDTVKRTAAELDDIEGRYLSGGGVFSVKETLGQLSDQEDRRRFLAAMMVRSREVGGLPDTFISKNTEAFIDPAEPSVLYAADPMVNVPLNDPPGLSAASGGDLFHRFWGEETLSPLHQ